MTGEIVIGEPVDADGLPAETEETAPPEVAHVPSPRRKVLAVPPVGT